MEKNTNKGLIVLTIILSILVVGLSIYLVYDKVLNDDNTINGENDVVDNDNTNAENNNNVINDNNSEVKILEIFSKFVGKYNYEYIYENDSTYANGCKDFNNLELKNDGTYTYSYGGTCANGSRASGNYSISKNKIYLFNDNCELALIGEECIYPNCEKVIELNYVEDANKIIISDGNIILEKE